MLLSLRTTLATLALVGVSRAAVCDDPLSHAPNGGTYNICFGKDSLASAKSQQAARDEYCGRNKWQSNTCYTPSVSTYKAPYYIHISQAGRGDQQTCLAALSDIIHECSGYGTATVGGVTYTMSGCNNGRLACRGSN
ncbi:hypothetical protein BGZ63DRAFT_462739 [Mariannaea sp. PMI_226]|nr:hypothetical protein BGZ63DRAFT_462739 [Mariannaea sp. PMI_226]